MRPRRLPAIPEHGPVWDAADDVAVCPRGSGRRGGGPPHPAPAQAYPPPSGEDLSSQLSALGPAGFPRQGRAGAQRRRRPGQLRARGTRDGRGAEGQLWVGAGPPNWRLRSRGPGVRRGGWTMSPSPGAGGSGPQREAALRRCSVRAPTGRAASIPYNRPGGPQTSTGAAGALPRVNVLARVCLCMCRGCVFAVCL